MLMGIDRFFIPPLDVQANWMEQQKVETLLFCPNAWALRHVFINQESGETIRARCNRWDCLYCGPRKVDQWRQLVKAAEPTLFLTLSKSGKTVEEAARALTVFTRSLRRGSKGKGPNRVGARDAYPIEYFAVLERHSNFEENGFHWHLLLKGVDFIPYKEVIQPAWRSATHGDAEIGHIEAIRKPHVIGYVTKYLTKNITRGEKGVREEVREMIALGLDEQGRQVEQRHTYTFEVTSRARRIRYSRHFFPESVVDLRTRLFAEMEQEAMEETGNSKPIEGEQAQEDEGKAFARSPWCLVEQETFTNDLQEYKRRRRVALLEALNDIRRGERKLSRRVINTWAYQRNEARQERSET